MNTFVENGADINFSKEQNIYLVRTPHLHKIELNTITSVIKYYFGDDKKNKKINEEDENNMTPTCILLATSEMIQQI